MPIAKDQKRAIMTNLQWTNLGQKFSSNTDLANVEGIHIFADIVPFLLLWKVKMLLGTMFLLVRYAYIWFSFTPLAMPDKKKQIFIFRFLSTPIKPSSLIVSNCGDC
jgi:hypothetical protein